MQFPISQMSLARGSSRLVYIFPALLTAPLSRVVPWVVLSLPYTEARCLMEAGHQLRPSGTLPSLPCASLIR